MPRPWVIRQESSKDLGVECQAVSASRFQQRHTRFGNRGLRVKELEGRWRRRI